MSTVELMMLFLVCLLLPVALMAAGLPVEPEVVVPDKAFDYGKAIKGTLRLPEETARTGLTLSARLSDSLGRVLQEESLPLPKETSFTEIPFEIEPRGVVAQRHTLALILKRRGKEVWTAREKTLLKPSRVWDDYYVMMWQRHNAKRWEYLNEDGIRYTHWSPFWEPAEFVDAGMLNYIDNVITPFYSPYHMWMPDKDKTFYFKLAMEHYARDRTNPENFVRTPCMADPVTLRWLERTCRIAAQRQSPTAPLWYSLADEPGIADQAAPSDFDWHPESLRDFREWLKKEHGSLEALNAEWGTDYREWHKVLPMTNDEGVAAAYSNPAAWVDFRDYMDTQMCRSYKLGADAIRSGDPGTYAGIGGVQGPEAVGCWDFYKMAHAMEVYETYYIGNNAELLRSLRDFGLPLKLIYSHFGGSDVNKQYEWWLFMHGADASLIWDDKSDWVSDDGRRSPRALKMRPMHQEHVNGLGRQLLHSHRFDDPIAIYFSQASLRVHWVRELADSGRDWSQRRSWHERRDSLALKRRVSWVCLIEDCGFQYKFVFDEQVRKDGEIENLDALDKEGFKVLVLPTVVAMSEKEEKAIRDFVAKGGTVIADGLLHLADHRGKPVDKGLGELFGVKESERPKTGRPLEFGYNELSSGAEFNAAAENAGKRCFVTTKQGKGQTVFVNLDLMRYAGNRHKPGAEGQIRAAFAELLNAVLDKSRRSPAITKADGAPTQCIETFQWESGKLRFIGVMRNPLQRSHELGGLEQNKPRPLDVPTDLLLQSIPGIDPNRVDIYDTRKGGKLAGLPLRFTLDPFEPQIFTIAPKGFEPGKPDMPKRTTPLKSLVEKPYTITFPKTKTGSEEVYHVVVTDPGGRQQWRYGGNVSATGKGDVEFEIPFALNDAPGEWRIEVRHIPTGASWNSTLTIRR